jgi:hypothetical protein
MEQMSETYERETTMTEKQLFLLRDWFREEVEYLIKKNTKKSTTHDYDYDYRDADYYANVAFNKVLDEFCGNEND